MACYSNTSQVLERSTLAKLPWLSLWIACWWTWTMVFWQDYQALFEKPLTSLTIGSCPGSLRLINYKRHRYSSSSPILKGDYRKSALMVCYPAPFPNIRGSTRLNFWVRSWSSFSLNRNLHIPHNAPYLSPKILHKLCFSFLLAITAVPKEIENNAYAKFWGVNQVHFGRCASDVWSTIKCTQHELVHPIYADNTTQVVAGHNVMDEDLRSINKWAAKTEWHWMLRRLRVYDMPQA